MFSVEVSSKESKYMAYAESELVNLALRIDNQIHLLSNVKNDLDTIEKTKEYKQISTVKSLISRNIEHYESFDEIKLIKENFKYKLRTAYPRLSANDIRLASLIRLSYSSKQISDIMCIKVRSVEKQRCRLRKKMELSANQNLLSILLSL